MFGFCFSLFPDSTVTSTGVEGQPEVDESLTTHHSASASRNVRGKTEPQPESIVNINNTQMRKYASTRSGYSSGASSTVTEENVDYRSGVDCIEYFGLPRQTDILSLSTLRQEMVADGELTKTVVRIEVRAYMNIVRPFSIYSSVYVIILTPFRT